MPGSWFVRVGVSGVLLVGCSEDTRPKDPTSTSDATAADADADDTAGEEGSTGTTTEDDGDGTTSTGTDTEAEADSEADDATGETGDGPLLDVATGTAETGADEGCKKIDFLFVIDNSGSMLEEQMALTDSFPGFIAAIEAEVEVDDFHVMVVDTDEHRAGVVAGGQPGTCDTWCPNCLAPPSTTGCQCDDMFCPEPDPCDATLGAGVRWAKDRSDCGFDTTDRYMQAGQADLTGTFECVANVGTSGDVNERQIGALLQGLGPLNEPGACNDGFLRDDAILVVTLISDEEDEFTGGTPQQWHDDLVALKGNDENAIVLLGLLNDTSEPAGVCNDMFIQAPLMLEFAELFDNGSWASVCEPAYSMFFADAISVIDSSCDEFIPPG